MNILDTTSWSLNPEVLKLMMTELEIDGEEKDSKVVIDFQNLNPFVLEQLDSDEMTLFVIPDWPCASWYKPLHKFIKAEAAILPEQPDLFLDPKGNPIGLLAWRCWLFYKA